jgi:hypothetical protein
MNMESNKVVGDLRLRGVCAAGRKKGLLKMVGGQYLESRLEIQEGGDAKRR